MPGPFDSDKTKGTFENDISCIKQNDVWSSKTFNNFIKSFYNRYCSDANFERTFADNDRQRIALDNTSFSGSDSHDYKDTEHSIDIADALFHVNKTLKRVECYLVDRGTDISDFYYNEGEDTISVTPVEGKGYNAVERDQALEPLMRLFCGRGDVSLNIPPYAMFPVLSDTTSVTLEESQTVNSPEHDAYFCVTYSEGETSISDPDNPDSAVTQHIVPRYATTCELVLIYDPTIVDEGNTVISRVDGNIIRETHGGTTPVEDVTTKLTLTFGQSAKLTDLCYYLNHLTCETYNKFSAKLVGNARGDQTILKALMLSDEPDTSKSITKVFRFVPIKPCISFNESTLRFLSALTAPEGEGQAPNLVESITKYAYVPLTTNNTVVPVANTGNGQDDDAASTEDTEPVEEADEPVERAVFVHTGTYGFILGAKNGGNPIDLPAMVNADDMQFIYIPDKLNRSHYIPSADAQSNPLPDWYKTLPAGINKAVTRDYNAEFFFIPFITVTERTIEIADFIVDIDTVLELGDFITEILPGRYTPKLIESNVTYDAWWAARRSKKLYGAADQIYKKYRRGLYGVYEDETHTHRELKDLQVKRPRPNSLVRTLQMMTGLTWQLNNIVWIDPMLASTDPDTPDGSSPALKMFSGYDKIFEYEDTYSGPGSILTPETTVVYLLRAYSTNNSVLFDASWSKRLPSGMHHVALNLAQDTPAVTSPDFNGTPVDYKLGTVTFRLVQPGSGPAVTDFELHRQFFDLSGLKLAAAEGFSTLKRVTLYYGSYSDINVDEAVTDTVYVVGADILKASISTAYIRLSEVKSVINTTFILTPAVHGNLSAIDTFLYLDGTNMGGMANAVVDVTFSFIDLRSGELKEARDLSQIHSLIKIGGKITGSKLRFAIRDNGNMTDWVAPDGETTYPKDTWQAFDPDILFPAAAGNDSTFPDTFMFIDCGLFSTEGQGRFVNCDLNVDLSGDFTRREPFYIPDDLYVSSDTPKQFRYCVDSQFFASRMFRKSPYVFYLADRHPAKYYNNDTQFMTYNYPVQQSDNLRLSFTLGKCDRMAVRYDVSQSQPGIRPCSPSLPSLNLPDEDSLLTTVWCRSFIAGLKNSSVEMPSTYMPTVVKHSFEVKTEDPKYRQKLTYAPQEHVLAGGYAVALFDSVTNCSLNLGVLDTTYPLQDEWEYDGADYRPAEAAGISVVYWAEPAWGFQFFTYPHDLAVTTSYKDKQINRGNTLYVAEWVTRQLVSGIYGLYDSKVTINYSFTTQGGYLNMPEDNFQKDSAGIISGSDLRGPVRWDMCFADPGSINVFSKTFIDPIDITLGAYYLPATPLFYLAEVYSSDIKLNLSPKQGYLGYVPLRGSRLDVNDMRERYRVGSYDAGTLENRVKAPMPDCVPDFVPDYTEDSAGLHYGFPKQRTLRLVVGYSLSVQTERWLTAPSSYNTIFAHITRANLVAGVMNKVSGWCYRLLATRTTDFVPERYHLSGDWDLTDIFSPQPPLTEDLVDPVQLASGIEGARYQTGTSILDHDTKVKYVYRADGSVALTGILGTVKTAVVTKELSFDCCVPGLERHEPKYLLDNLALLHADYPVSGQTSFLWDTSANDTMQNGNALVHSSSREWSTSGFDLAVPGFAGAFNADTDPSLTVAGFPTRETAEAGYAGPLSEPSFTGYTLIGTSTEAAANYSELYWNQNATKKFGQRTPIVDALNVADLNVIQIATSEIAYVTPVRAAMGDKATVTLFSDKPFKEWKVPRGGLLHTVIALGWVLNLHRYQPTEIVPRSTPSLNDITAILPGISEGLATQIQSGVADGTIQYNGTSFSFPEGWFGSATYTENDGTLLKTDWTDSGSLTFHPITITPVNFGE